MEAGIFEVLGGKNGIVRRKKEPGGGKDNSDVDCSNKGIFVLCREPLEDNDKIHNYHNKSKEKGNTANRFGAILRDREDRANDTPAVHFLSDRISSTPRIALHLGGKGSSIMLPYPLTSSCSNSSTALRLLMKSFGESRIQPSRQR